MMPIYAKEPPVWARCNSDGHDIFPADRKLIETFAIWLQMDDDERIDAVRLDPEWRKFALGKVLGPE